MCGIAGYIGDKNTPEILVEMLKRLEYRGYDSAGIACISDNSVIVYKDRGVVSEVMDKPDRKQIHSKVGIAHTRWATHGEPSKSNAHPHVDCTGSFVVAHNGIIENYRDLKAELIDKGHRFESDTDTEVIPHLIEELYAGSFEEAFRNSLDKLRGSFAIAAISKNEPDRILIARKDSPLIVGLGDGENFIASDAPAVLPYTKKILILDDFDYGIVSKDQVILKDIQTGNEITRDIHEIQWDITRAEKEGYPHFMLKEIFEEPTAVEDAMKTLHDVEYVAKKLKKYQRIYFLGCGTASYAGLVGKYLLERFSIPSELVLSSEFRYSTVNTVDENCAIIAVSQSGETSDTLASVKAARNRGAYILSIVNVVGSSLTRVSDNVIYTHSGPEIAVASTKAYVGQLTSITLLSIYLAKELGRIQGDYLNEIIDDMHSLPDKIRQILSREDKIKELAENLSEKNIFLYIGRRLNYPTALEGALKIKEVSYVHAEAYPAGELKHGPIALLEAGVPVVAINPNDDLMEKMDSNIQEARSRNATIITVGENCKIETPVTDPMLSPILYIVPLHLFAYHMATSRGLNPDKPRNLAKSVTVE